LNEESGSKVKIVVLGGAGFIGSHLVDRLTSNGHSVSVLDLAQSPNPLVENHFVGSHADTSLLKQAMDGMDVVCHLISTTVPASSNKNIEFDIETNLIASIRVFEVMRQLDVRKVVYLSSGGAVYGNPTTCPISENHNLDPTSSYGIVKVAVEKYLQMYEQLYEFQPLIVRPANAYGPGQNLKKPQGVIGHFLNNALHDRPIQVWGDGTVRRDYIFVSDLVNMIATAIEAGASGIYNAGAGVDFSVLEIINIIEEVLGHTLEKEFMESKDYDVEKVRLDIEAAKQAFGWTPSVALREGIQRQLASYSRAN